MCITASLQLNSTFALSSSILAVPVSSKKFFSIRLYFKASKYCRKHSFTKVESECGEQNCITCGTNVQVLRQFNGLAQIEIDWVLIYASSSLFWKARLTSSSQQARPFYQRSHSVALLLHELQHPILERPSLLPYQRLEHPQSDYGLVDYVCWKTAAFEISNAQDRDLKGQYLDCNHPGSEASPDKLHVFWLVCVRFVQCFFCAFWGWKEAALDHPLIQRQHVLFFVIENDRLRRLSSRLRSESFQFNWIFVTHLSNSRQHRALDFGFLWVDIGSWMNKHIRNVTGDIVKTWSLQANDKWRKKAEPGRGIDGISIFIFQ